MNVMIMTDLEGISGVDTIDCITDGTELNYKARERLMADINAAVDGCFLGGADKVYVADGHFKGTNFIDGLLDPRAIAVTVQDYSDLIVKGEIDACMEIGAHAKAGTINAFLEHTQSSRTIFAYSVNGVEYGEAAQGAIFAGAFGVPLVMVSGDVAACEEAKAVFGEKIATAAVKKALRRNVAECMDLKEAEDLIRAAAKDGVERYKEFEPFCVDMPMTVHQVYMRTDFCETILDIYKDAVKRVDSRTVEKVVDKITCYKDVLI